MDLTKPQLPENLDNIDLDGEFNPPQKNFDATRVGADDTIALNDQTMATKKMADQTTNLAANNTIGDILSEMESKPKPQSQQQFKSASALK